MFYHGFKLHCKAFFKLWGGVSKIWRQQSVLGLDGFNIKDDKFDLIISMPRLSGNCEPNQFCSFDSGPLSFRISVRPSLCFSAFLYKFAFMVVQLWRLDLRSWTRGEPCATLRGPILSLPKFMSSQTSYKPQFM
jgi:hypothetical protein